MRLQELMAAEQQASEIVADARKGNGVFQFVLPTNSHFISRMCVDFFTRTWRQDETGEV
jgi:hypothetical protein